MSRQAALEFIYSWILRTGSRVSSAALKKLAALDQMFVLSGYLQIFHADNKKPSRNNDVKRMPAHQAAKSAFDYSQWNFRTEITEKTIPKTIKHSECNQKRFARFWCGIESLRAILRRISLPV